MNPAFLRLANRLQGWSPWTVFALGLSYVLALWMVDMGTSPATSFVIFYVLGVAFVGWSAGGWPAAVLSAVSTGLMLPHDWSFLRTEPMGTWILVWNTASRFLVFCCTGLLAAQLARLTSRLGQLVEAQTARWKTEAEQHKATAAQLGEALERLEQITNHISEVFWLVDLRQNRLLYVSPAYEKVFGRPREALYKNQESWLDPVHPDDRHRLRKLSANLPNGSLVAEYRLLRSDGQVRWIHDRAFPIADAQGKVIQIAGVAVDITDRQRLERQILEISDREQARLGQEIHDGLCQHLVSLAFDANSLERELLAQGRREAGTASRITRFLDETITEARQLSRGLFPIRLDAEGLASALEELARSIQQRFRLECRLEPAPPVVLDNQATATHLYRIAQEAITNAIKHGRARRISLWFQAGADHILLAVEDDGVGFDPYARNTMGMGLHIMDYRARSIGGILSVGRGANGGTRVSCCMPRPNP